METAEDIRKALLDLAAITNVAQLPPCDYRGDPFNAIKQCQATGASEPLAGMCEPVSSLIADYLNDRFQKEGVNGECIGVYDHPRFNHMHDYVRLKDRVFMVDGAAGGIVTQPLKLFKGVFAFVGARDELKQIVNEAERNTLALFQSLPAYAGKDQEDIDAGVRVDTQFAQAAWGVVEKGADKPIINEVPFGAIWQAKWSDVKPTIWGTNFPNPAYRTVWAPYIKQEWKRWEHMKKAAATRDPG